MEVPILILNVETYYYLALVEEYPSKKLKFKVEAKTCS